MSTQDTPFRIVVGADAAGRLYKDMLAHDLRASKLGAEGVDGGVNGSTHLVYPEIALRAAQFIATGEADRALLVCHTGLGMAIAANKVPGVRAVTAHDSMSVRAAVRSNNAQVLTFGQGVIGLGLARQLAAEWLTYRFDTGSSARAKVRTITDFEQRNGLGAVAAEGQV